MTTLTTIINCIHKEGGLPLAVGGSVRDELMGFKPKDFDIEVHGMTANTLITILSEFGKVSAVGISFGVIKLTTANGEDLDFSLPRRDNKTGSGHKGFQVEVDTSLTIEQAAARRDFTINSMARNMITGKLIDEFNGAIDLDNRVLRATTIAFAEDPLRVLRGMQFAGRFDMTASLDTAKLCQELMGEFDTLAQERVWGEWEKWATKSIKPSRGLDFLVDTDWVRLFPELSNLMNCPQDPIWHPEGDVWTHTKHVVDAMARVCERDGVTGDARIIKMFGALCHDFGKPAVTVKSDEGRWISPGHADAGAEPTRSFLARIGMPISMREAVVDCVQEHMVHVDFNGSERTVRRFIARLKSATVADIIAVIEADHSGRPPLPTGLPNPARAISEIAEAMGNKVEAIMMGRHMLAMGFKPGVSMGRVLKAAFEAQLDGAFADVDGGAAWIAANADNLV